IFMNYEAYIFILYLFYYYIGRTLYLHSFPTRRSSDLTAPEFDQALVKKDGRTTVDEYFWVPLILVFAWIAVELVFGVREYQLDRSEEHTSELQSRFDLVCRLLLEKKKKDLILIILHDA